MKKTIPALLLACVLFACKKETTSNESPASQSKVPVTFSLENFMVSQQDMSENGRVETDPSLAKFKTVFYMAFASDGSPVSYIEQDSTNANFGVISDSLLPGTYTVALGAWNRMGNYACYITTKHTSLATAEFYNMYSRNTGDVFYKKLQVTVNNGTASLNDVTLNRIVGSLKVDLKDALPKADPNGEISIYTSAPADYMINTDLTANQQMIYLDRTSQTTWEYLMFPPNGPLTLYFGWKDRITGAPQTKTISNVTVSANKKTIVTGNLYGVPTNVAGSFVTRTSPDWSSDSTVIDFN